MIIHNATYTEISGLIAASIDITYAYINDELEIKHGTILFNSFTQTFRIEIQPENHQAILNQFGGRMRRTAMDDIAKLKAEALLDLGRYEQFHAIQKERAHYDS